MGGTHILDRLYEVVTKRKGGDPERSYTAQLFAMGRTRIAQKVGEEALETILATITKERKGIVNESADLLYHLTVLWAEADIEPAAVWRVLEQRFGTSGLDEKKARS